MSTAMRSAAQGVRLALRVCNSHSTPDLHGELEVLRVAEQPFQGAAHRLQPGGGAGQHAGQPRPAIGGAPPGHHVLALAVEDEIHIEAAHAGRRVAGEADARARGAAGIAEHHRLHRHRRAGLVGEPVQAAVGGGLRRIPRAEHRHRRRQQLRRAARREGPAGQRAEPLQHGWVSSRSARWSSSRSLSIPACASAAASVVERRRPAGPGPPRHSPAPAGGSCPRPGAGCR